MKLFQLLRNSLKIRLDEFCVVAPLCLLSSYLAGIRNGSFMVTVFSVDFYY